MVFSDSVKLVPLKRRCRDAKQEVLARNLRIQPVISRKTIWQPRYRVKLGSPRITRLRRISRGVKEAAGVCNPTSQGILAVGY